MLIPTECDNPSVPTPQVTPEPPKEASEPTLVPPVDYKKEIEELRLNNAKLQEQIDELKKAQKESVEDETRKHQIKTYY